MLSRIRRWIYLAHRWLGIALCLFMAMWFVSGVVMLYVGYPKLTNAERLGHLPTLAADRVLVNLRQALAATGQSGIPDAIRLTSIDGAPRYIFSYGQNLVAVDAVAGGRIEGLQASSSLAAATRFLPDTNAEYLGVIDEDPWTHSRALDPHRPLHVVQMADAESTRLYLSSTTGEVVRDATAHERVWNWLGAWIHWLYPFRGGALNAYWAEIIIYSSLAGSILTLLGMVVGILRWRFNGRYKTGARTPYRYRWLRWHHVSGLLFGPVIFTWVISGLFSMNPWKIFDSGIKLDQKSYMGGVLTPARFPLSAPQALGRFAAQGLVAHELEWRLLAGNAYYLAFDETGRSRLLSATQNSADSFERFDWTQLAQAAQALMPQAKLIQRQVLGEYDFYYYGRAAHTMTGHVEKRLPILRLVFDDPTATWLHLDPYTGDFQKLDALDRTNRWLFAFLHSWDWLPLLNHRPLWDIWMIGFSFGGFSVSLFGMVIGWRRLRLKLRLDR